MIRVLVQILLRGYAVKPAAPVGIDKRGHDPLSQGLQLVKKPAGSSRGKPAK